MPADARVFPFGKILVGLTRTEMDAELLRYAGMLAESAGEIEFQFVHVLGVPEVDGHAASSSPSDAFRDIEESVATHFRFSGPGQRVTISCHVVEGSRIDRLLEFAVREGNDLILIGHRRVRSGRRSMARRLAMKAPCSLWLVPAGTPASITRVMGAVDFSYQSAYALSLAAAVAGSRGLEECLSLNVHFNQLTIGDGEPGTRLRKIKESEFQAFLRPLALHGVAVRPIIEESYAVAATIAQTAERERVDLIVMGTRGRSPSAAVLLGSESEQTIMETRTPVLVVKAAGERTGLIQVLLQSDLRTNRVAVG